jgi:hypothetical protein
MVNQDQIHLLARVAALEFLLEMGYATWVAQMTASEIEEFQREFEERLRTTWTQSQIDPFVGGSEIGTDVIREAQGVAVRFWKRVRERQSSIRSGRGVRRQ